MPNKKIGGMIDTIELDHTNNIPEEPSKTTDEAKKSAEEELNYNGITVATREKNGNIICFDTKGQEIKSEKLATLYKEYDVEPATNEQDFPKKGEPKIRFTKEIIEDVPAEDGSGRVFKRRKTIDCPEGEAEMVSWTQEYEDGQVKTRTVEARLYPIVKFLRGEIDFAKKEE